jgi:hypothetical protein
MKKVRADSHSRGPESAGQPAMRQLWPPMRAKSSLAAIGAGSAYPAPCVASRHVRAALQKLQSSPDFR